MEKLDLSNITLVTVNSDCPGEGVHALKYSSNHINFKDVVLLTHADKEYEGITKIKTPNIKSVKMYNDFMLGLGNYIDSEYLLVIQSDGFVVNPNMWDTQFLEYDYIGAPWPNNPQWIQDQSEEKQKTLQQGIEKNRIGNGGFSLRSRKFLNYSKHYNDCEGLGEDFFLCALNYDNAIKHDIKFPSLDIAYKFSYENRCEEFNDNYRNPYYFDTNKHFGFHNSNFVNEKEILNLKYGD